MKREGAVRVSRSKVLRIADGEEVALGKAAAAKPSNASKNAAAGGGGKCRRPGCNHHHHSLGTPTKSRDKAKGAHKLRACDVALNHRLVSWRVVDGGGRTGGGVPDYKGASASAVLAYLAGSGSGGSSWYEDDDDGSALEATPPANTGLYDLIVGCHAAAPAGKEADDLARPTDITDTDAIEEQEDEEEGYCMVGITIALEFSDGEEDWIVVEEI